MWCGRVAQWRGVRRPFCAVVTSFRLTAADPKRSTPRDETRGAGRGLFLFVVATFHLVEGSLVEGRRPVQVFPCLACRRCVIIKTQVILCVMNSIPCCFRAVCRVTVPPRYLPEASSVSFSVQLACRVQMALSLNRNSPSPGSLNNAPR